MRRIRSGLRRPVLAPRRLRGADRQRRLDAVLGRGRRSVSIERRSTHLVIGEFSSKFAAVTRAAPHLDDPQVCETAPGETPAAPRPRRRRRLRVSAQRDLDRRDGAVHRPGGRRARRRRRHVGRGRHARRRRPRSTSTTSRRRSASRATAACGSRCCSPARDRAHRAAHAAERWMPPTLDLSIAVENSRLDQTYNTPALATHLPARPPAPVDARQRRARVRGRPLRHVGRRSSTAGPTATRTRRRSSTDAGARSHVTATIDFDDTVDAAALAAALRANGIVDVEPYRKLGRNQLRIALFPAIEPDDVDALTRAIDFMHRAHRPGLTQRGSMLLLHEVHTVAGRHEDEFEAAFRDGWMPTLARRRRRPPPLLPEARARHRTRVPPRHDHRAARRRRVRAARDAASRRGDLRSWAADVDRLRHEVKGKLLLPVDWSPMQRPRPRDRARPTAASTTPRSTWKTARGRTRRKLDTYLEKARTHYAPSLEQRTERSLLTLLGVFQAALGAPRRREVVLWQRVDFPERLPGPVHPRAARAREGPGHVDARRARSARRLGEPPAAQRDLVAARLSAD